MSKSKASKFQAEPGGGVMGTLSETLPDERPITALHVVEQGGRCPAGYWPILKTYDEDSDADLWRQPLLFGKRSCRYLCISKSEGIAGRTVSALRVISSSDPPPAGFSCLPLTADSGARAWRKRQLCYLLAPGAPAGPLTDIILCSRLKKAPDGFQYAGEINGVMLCYKVGGGSNSASPFHMPGPVTGLILSSPLRGADTNTNGDGNYENIALNGHYTPDGNKRRVPPERPPKTSALVAELNRLNLQETKQSPSPGKKYTALESPSQKDPALQPSRRAPPAPRPPRPAPPLPLPAHPTLGGWSGLEGVPFALNSKLGGLSGISMIHYPVIKKKSLFQLDQEYTYSFMLEHQT